MKVFERGITETLRPPGFLDGLAVARAWQPGRAVGGWLASFCLPHPASPRRLAQFRDPFDHPAWLFELKWDGFRALERGACRLVSRNNHDFRGFPSLFDSLAAALGSHRNQSPMHSGGCRVANPVI